MYRSVPVYLCGPHSMANNGFVLLCGALDPVHSREAFRLAQAEPLSAPPKRRMAAPDVEPEVHLL
jgi:hypothetical protein